MDIIAIKIKKNLQVRSHSLSEREIAYLSKLVNMLRSWLKVTTGDLFKNIYLCTLAKHMNFTCKHHFKFLKIIYYVVKFKSSNFTTVKLAQIIMFANYKRWLENCYQKKKSTKCAKNTPEEGCAGKNGRERKWRYTKRKTEQKRKANIPTPKSIHKCSNRQPEKRK